MSRTIKRKYYIDWVRIIVVLILIPFHTAVSFSHIGKGYVYTPEPVNSALYIFISDFFNLWFMRMLFFISGISTFIGLQKRTPGIFIKERIKRLAVPVVFCLATVGPLSGYILAVNKYGFSGSFAAYYPLFFLHPEQYLFWGHMWFCVYLFIFSLTALPLFILLLQRPVIHTQINKFLDKGNRIFLPALIVILFEAWLRPFYPGYQTFIGDWANVSVYFLFYVLGFLLWQSPVLINTIIQKRFIFLWLAILTTFFYFMIKRIIPVTISYQLSLILSALWGTAAYAWVFCILAFANIFLNSRNKALSFLSNSSFSLYVFHYLILSVWNFFLLKTDINHYCIWLLTILGTYFTFGILYELFIKRISVLRYILGIR